jgi:predicted nucleic acid-binding protein
VARAEPLWVLDTSVAVAWLFTDEPQHREALRLLGRLREEPERFLVPHLFLSEVVHVLARKSGRDRTFVRTAVDLLVRLGIRTLPLSDRAIGRMADWACRGLSGYDATFVALAEDLGGRWVTADARAARLAGRTHARTLSAWARSAGR